MQRLKVRGTTRFNMILVLLLNEKEAMYMYDGKIIVVNSTGITGSCFMDAGGCYSR